MCLPVLYKADDERRWHEGVTVNLSSRGALIDGELPATPDNSIVVVIPLLTSEGCLTGRGHVVREAGAGPEQRGFAIVVPQFHLERQSAALAHLDTLHQEC